MANPAAALARGRALAETLMVDTCTIRRKASETTDETTGVITPTYGPTIYSGRCRVQQSQLGASSSSTDPGEAAVRLVAFELQVPMSVTGMREGDEVTITAATHDDDLPGRVFTVVGLAHKTHATSRRVQVQEVTT